MTMIRHARGEFPVTDDFAKASGLLLQATHVDLEKARGELLTASNHRRLSDQELAYLAQVTHVINVHRSLDVFDDWKPGSLDLTHADQLHGNSRQHDCGCHIHVAFNHYDHTHVRGHRIHKTCKGHDKFADPQALVEQLQKPKPSK